MLVYGTQGATLHFNYRTKFNECWDDLGWQRQYGYEVEYGDGTLTVNVWWLFRTVGTQYVRAGSLGAATAGAVTRRDVDSCC